MTGKLTGKATRRLVGRSLSGWVAGLSLSLLGAAIALADVPFPLWDILPYLQTQTSVPIFLPDVLPAAEVEQIYISAEADNISYSLSLDYTQDCRGATACNIGSLSAEVGGFSFGPNDLLPGDQFALVTLTDGTQGGFFNFCGAYCSAILQWERGGVLYTMYLKNGTLEELLTIANSAIAAGPR